MELDPVIMVYCPSQLICFTNSLRFGQSQFELISRLSERVERCTIRKYVTSPASSTLTDWVIYSRRVMPKPSPDAKSWNMNLPRARRRKRYFLLRESSSDDQLRICINSRNAAPARYLQPESGRLLVSGMMGRASNTLVCDPGPISRLLWGRGGGRKRERGP
jgi:hypothetical protein